MNGKLNAKINKIQRYTAIRVIAGYRTISADAALVLAGISPASLHTGYYKRVYSRIRDLKNLNLWSKKEEREIKSNEKILMYRQYSTFKETMQLANVLAMPPYPFFSNGSAEHTDR